MNDKKISFIVCSNSEYYMQECLLYLSELIVPEGFEVDIVEVTGAKSMAAGYNDGMSRTDAKYKIYMHQDVFIINKKFLLDLLYLFHKDTAIGMIGMVGTPYLVKSGVMWHGIRFGSFYKLQKYVQKNMIQRFCSLETGYLEVEAVDGLLIATQYDRPWREDIFKKWDFYDVSQSFEFLKAGYKVVVPGQKPEWFIHDCGIPNLDNYYEECKAFLENYGEYMKSRQEETWNDYLKQVHVRLEAGLRGTEEAKEHLLQLLDGLADEKDLGVL